MHIEELKNSPVIVEHTGESLIVIFVNPHNFRQNKYKKWLFDCDRFYVFMPMWVDKSEKRIRIHPGGGKDSLTDTIQRLNDFMPLDEWLSEGHGQEALLRIFE